MPCCSCYGASTRACYRCRHIFRYHEIAILLVQGGKPVCMPFQTQPEVQLAIEDWMMVACARLDTGSLCRSNQSCICQATACKLGNCHAALSRQDRSQSPLCMLLLQAQLQVQLAVEDGIAGLRDDIRSLHLDVLRNSQIQQVRPCWLKRERKGPVQQTSMMCHHSGRFAISLVRLQGLWHSHVI